MPWFSKPEGIEEPGPTLTSHRAEEGEAAIVFLHGQGGNPAATWGSFPEYLMAEAALDGWDLLSVGFSSSLRLDRVRVSNAPVPLDRFALLLRTLAESRLQGYQRLAILAHGVGGLIVQRVLVDDPLLASKTAHVFLFATPSGGLAKAALTRAWRRQLEDLIEGGKLIEQLRKAWASRFSAGMPFRLLTIAGSDDELVPAVSSLGPFAVEDQAVVAGDHLGIVRPTGPDHPSVRLIVGRLTGGAAPEGPWSYARVAVQKGDFEQAVLQLEPHKEALGEDSLLSLALALEGVGRTEDAIELIEELHGGEPTEPRVVLGDWRKRRWLATGSAADAERGYQLYQEARSRVDDDEDPLQASYLAINTAFLELVHHKDYRAAQHQARLALHHVRRSGDEDHRALATQAEAFVYLGEIEKALSKYRQALSAAPSHRESEAIFQQATTVSGQLKDATLTDRLANLFRGGVGSSWA